MGSHRKGSNVKWNWGRSTATGKAVERFDRSVTRTIKASRITTHGGDDDPAYLIEQDDGDDEVLKLDSELHD